MTRFRSALRLPKGFPPCNLSVTCGDTSPCRRGLGIPQTSPLRQGLPYQGSWRAVGETERLYYMARFRFVSRFSHPAANPFINAFTYRIKLLIHLAV